ncbi:hypothetical protein [Roseivirga sp. E12]|uniref:hypothetical protein n=1 Tax=Roseivirga sp. E12 TaxID=2819237 RepID=UPI001ABC1217|nr:hypothetical protein [Roseivirga sp. E12]MBO3699669.1 hypothetical protein [Roseivirga sp. E12]
MNNFEKFKNKEISQTESSEVMGGNLYHFCLLALPVECIYQNFFINAIICGALIAGTPFWEVCLDTACGNALTECEIQ